MIRLLNQLLNGITDWLLRTFAVVSPWPGLIFASLLTAAVLVVLFAWTSHPARLLRSRNRLLARTLELLLFQHDLRVSLTACGRILWANAVYLGQLLQPMAVGLIPLVLIFVQLEAWFDRRPLLPGETAVVSAAIDPRFPVATTQLELVVPENIRLDSPAVRTPTRNEVAWRVVAQNSGRKNLQLQVGEHREQKALVVGDRLARVSTRRVSAGVVNEVFSPSEPPLAVSSPIQAIQVHYPARELTIGLTEVPWIVAALVLMMIFSLVLSMLFGVRIY